MFGSHEYDNNSSGQALQSFELESMYSKRMRTEAPAEQSAFYEYEETASQASYDTPDSNHTYDQGSAATGTQSVYVANRFHQGNVNMPIPVINKFTQTAFNAAVNNNPLLLASLIGTHRSFFIGNNENTKAQAKKIVELNAKLLEASIPYFILGNVLNTANDLLKHDPIDTEPSHIKLEDYRYDREAKSIRRLYDERDRRLDLFLKSCDLKYTQRGLLETLSTIEEQFAIAYDWKTGKASPEAYSKFPRTQVQPRLKSTYENSVKWFREELQACIFTDEEDGENKFDQFKLASLLEKKQVEYRNLTIEITQLAQQSAHTAMVYKINVEYATEAEKRHIAAVEALTELPPNITLQELMLSHMNVNQVRDANGFTLMDTALYNQAWDAAYTLYKNGYDIEHTLNANGISALRYGNISLDRFYEKMREMELKDVPAKPSPFRQDVRAVLRTYSELQKKRAHSRVRRIGLSKDILQERSIALEDLQQLEKSLTDEALAVYIETHCSKGKSGLVGRDHLNHPLLNLAIRYRRESNYGYHQFSGGVLQPESQIVVRGMQEQVVTLQNENKTLKHQVSTLKSNHEASCVTNRELRGSLNNESEQNQTLKQELDRTAAERDRLKEKLGEAINQRDEAVELRDNLVGERDIYMRKYKESVQENQSKDVTITEYAQSLASANAENAQLRNYVLWQQQQIAQQQQQMAEQKQQLAEKDRVDAAKDQQLELAKQQLAEKDRLNAAKDQQLALAKQQLAEQGQRLAEQDNEIAHLRSEVTELRRKDALRDQESLQQNQKINMLMRFMHQTQQAKENPVGQAGPSQQQPTAPQTTHGLPAQRFVTTPPQRYGRRT